MDRTAQKDLYVKNCDDDDIWRTNDLQLELNKTLDFCK